MKYLFLSFCAIGALLSGAGCAMSSATDGNAGTAEAPAQLAEAEEIAVGNRILNAIQEKNYPEFRAMLGHGMFGNEMTEKDFDASGRQFESQFGSIVSYTFLTGLETPTVKNLIWKVTFERPSATAGNDPVRQELLFRLVTARPDGTVEVMGMGFL